MKPGVGAKRISGGRAVIEIKVYILDRPILSWDRLDMKGLLIFLIKFVMPKSIYN